jgi:cytochrome c1
MSILWKEVLREEKNMQFGFFDEPKRKPIKTIVKREVFKRAKGKCERCGIKMTMSQGHFHHTRKPSISPTAKSVQFLCPNCHSWHGHKRKTITRDKGTIFEEKEQITKRRAVKSKRTTRKKTTKKKMTKKKPTKKKATKKKSTKKPKRKVKKTTKKKKTITKRKAPKKKTKKRTTKKKTTKKRAKRKTKK